MNHEKFMELCGRLKCGELEPGSMDMAHLIEQARVGVYELLTLLHAMHLGYRRKCMENAILVRRIRTMETKSAASDVGASETAGRSNLT